MSSHFIDDDLGSDSNGGTSTSDAWRTIQHALNNTGDDPDDPPASVVVLSMGTETTDLVVTNGFRVWQRSIPLGGNHFTKQLTKELKLTFAKAEHLKRNARQAEDPKTGHHHQTRNATQDREQQKLLIQPKHFDRLFCKFPTS